MPYIHRNAQNEITGLTRWPSGSSEHLPDNHPDVVAFLNPPPTVDQLLAPTDKHMARAAEDLVALLITKGVITRAELDTTLVSRINERRTIRGQAAI